MLIVCFGNSATWKWIYMHTTWCQNDTNGGVQILPTYLSKLGSHFNQVKYDYGACFGESDAYTKYLSPWLCQIQ